MLTFTLIICSRGRPHHLDRALTGVAALRYPAFELVVIRDPNDIKTSLCLQRRAPTARLGDCSAANLAKARNIGLSMARGEIVAFLDDDSVPEPDWLDQIAAAYADPGITAAGGFIRGADGIKFQYRVVLIDEFGSDHRFAHIPSSLPRGYFLALTGTNFSVRRLAALEIGGFDEIFAYFLEETDFLLRLQQAGGRVSVVPAAEVHHGFAANELRQENGVPKSLRGIARSKAYFCHVNRQVETPGSAIEGALAAFAKKKRKQIAGHLRAGRLGAPDAARLLADLQAGFTEGETLANKGRSLLPISAAGGVAFESYMPPKQSASRLCVLINGTASSCTEYPMIRALARSDYEVTLICLGPAKRRSVSFTDGVWEHRLPVRWALSTRFSKYAVIAEIRRISGRRCFESIYVASDDPVLESVAATSGLPRFTPDLKSIRSNC